MLETPWCSHCLKLLHDIKEPGDGDLNVLSAQWERRPAGSASQAPEPPGAETRLPTQGSTDLPTSGLGNRTWREPQKHSAQWPQAVSTPPKKGDKALHQESMPEAVAL